MTQAKQAVFFALFLLLPRAKAGAGEGGQAAGAASRRSRNDDDAGKAIAEQKQATFSMAADMAMIQLAALGNKSTVVMPGARGAAMKLSVTPSVSTGRYTTSVVKSDGTLHVVGWGGLGGLGTGNSQNSVAFIQTLTGVQAVSNGNDHQVALKSDGSVWTTGGNSAWQLADPHDLSDKNTFQQVFTGVQAVSAGYYFTAVLKSDGKVWTAGRGTDHELGDRGTRNRASFGPVNFAHGSLSTCQAVAAGFRFMGVLKTDGTLWGVGRSSSGELGTGTTASRSTFVQVLSGVQAVSAGAHHMMALKTDGTAWATGHNFHGQLGIGGPVLVTSTYKYTFTQVMSNVQAVSAGHVQSAWLKADGTVLTCGYSGWGTAVLGDGSTTDRSTPVEVLDGAQAVASGGYHSAALKSDGTVWAVGLNDRGQLGSTPMGTDRSSFVQVLDAMVPTAAPTAAPTTAAPTAAPTTGAPTGAPTAAPVTPPANVAAKGDPHLTNMLGDHFDLMQPGVHVLVHIPRSAKASHTLLKIIAEVDHLGSACMDIYIQAVNVTGKWAFESNAGRRPRDIYFKAGQMPSQGAGWLRLGEVSLKVKEGHTSSGTRYLNVMVRDLSKVSKYSVGGLLGQDDHTLAATPVNGCVHTVDV